MTPLARKRRKLTTTALAETNAATLYLAINGWGNSLTCGWFVSETSDRRCGKPIAGVSADDGTPLCNKHVDDPEDDGHRLSPRVIACIREQRSALRKAAAKQRRGSE